MAYTKKQINTIIGDGVSRVIPKAAPLTLAQRVSESEVRRRVYSYEDAAARDVLRLFEGAYSDIREQAYALAEYGDVERLSTSDSASNEWRRLFNLYAATRIAQLLSESANLTLSLINPAFDAGYYGRAWSLDVSTRDDVPVRSRGYSPERVREMFGRQWLKSAGIAFFESFELIADTYRLKSRQQLNAASLNLETIGQMLKRFQKLLGLNYVSRGKRALGEAFWYTQNLIRNAVLSASNIGALMQYVEQSTPNGSNQGGLGSTYQLVTMEDERVCPTCDRLSQKIWPINAVLQDGEIGPSVQVPPIHPHCRCHPVFKIRDEYLLPDDQPPRETWREWLRRKGLDALLGDFMDEGIESTQVGDEVNYADI